MAILHQSQVVFMYLYYWIEDKIMKFIKNMQVYDQKQVQTQTQLVTVITHICPAYKIVLEYSANKVTAHYLDYENNPVDYNGEITFEFEGEQQAVQAVNGIAEIPFVVVDTGTYIVKTANLDVENGEVVINV